MQVSKLVAFGRQQFIVEKPDESGRADQPPGVAGAAGQEPFPLAIAAPDGY